jgi:hypothetical protein
LSIYCRFGLAASKSSIIAWFSGPFIFTHKKNFHAGKSRYRSFFFHPAFQVFAIDRKNSVCRREHEFWHEREDFSVLLGHLSVVRRPKVDKLNFVDECYVSRLRFDPVSVYGFLDTCLLIRQPLSGQPVAWP